MDIDRQLMQNYGLCLKDTNEGTGRFTDRMCQLFKPSDYSFSLQHLSSTVGYFTKDRRGMGRSGNEMNAKMYCRFSSQNGLKMTSMLLHKLKILHFNAPLMLVPPPTDASTEFLHQPPPSQDICNSVDFILSAFRCVIQLLPTDQILTMGEDDGHNACKRFVRPIQAPPSSKTMVKMSTVVTATMRKRPSGYQ
eukprot:scaffold5198_cov173-Amphora_coffeaeformis.AAC.15